MPVLLGDIGGTYARFAIAAGSDCGPVATLPVAGHADLAAAIRAFLATLPAVVPVVPVAAAFAAAGPVQDGRAVLTNSGWAVDADALRRDFGWRTVTVVNDFVALAWALPALAPADLAPIGPASATAAGGARLVIGPGTGLGVGCLLPGSVAVASEGGHATLAGSNAREDAVLALLRRQWGHASAERVLSGPGLVNLCAALASLDDAAPPPPRQPAEILAADRDGSDPHCREAINLFCALLGSFAGSAALMFGATGGVYLGGGILPRMSDRLAQSAFRARFTAKGRFAGYLAAVPTAVIRRPDPALPGLLRLLAAQGERS